jgi:hypothetical protein
MAQGRVRLHAECPEANPRLGEPVPSSCIYRCRTRLSHDSLAGEQGLAGSRSAESYGALDCRSSVHCSRHFSLRTTDVQRTARKELANDPGARLQVPRRSACRLSAACARSAPACASCPPFEFLLALASCSGTLISRGAVVGGQITGAFPITPRSTLRDRASLARDYVDRLHLVAWYCCWEGSGEHAVVGMLDGRCAELHKQNDIQDGTCWRKNRSDSRVSPEPETEKHSSRQDKSDRDAKKQDPKDQEKCVERHV